MKEGSVLFNDAVNTFYLRLYGVRYGKGPLSERENAMPTHYYSFRLLAWVLLYASSHHER